MTTLVQRMSSIMPGKMSNYQRVKFIKSLLFEQSQSRVPISQQWLTFSRQWHLVNAKWQDPFKLAEKVAYILDGRHKPIYSPEVDCGDHVVIYNCCDVAMRAFDWKRIDYYFNNEHPRGKADIAAWEIHESDPNRIMWMAVYWELRGPFETRLRNCHRLHLFSNDKIPDEILKNVSNQMKQIMKQPKRIDEYSEAEKENFPNLFELSKDFVFEPGNVKK